MGIIRILDEQTANRIAAGEVVERPASVVKELVENSLDAGAGRIDVFVEEGGLSLIRVSDNGSGIARDDMELAFHRHATSKVRSGRDLFRIRSLGFRGEALASIAAVAKVECVSHDGTEPSGWKIALHGGEIVARESVAAERGTTMFVRDLFYNTPARLKYLKSISTELGHISDYMYRMAMAHPSVSFTLRHNGNTLLRTSGSGDLLQAIAAVYGTSAAKQLIAVRGEDLDYELYGYISRPELTRAARSAVAAFVNGRYIRNYALQKAVLDAYHTLLPVHRFPLAVLHLRMDPALVDVNVHPAKLEVRFSKEAELMRLVERTLRDCLRRENLIPQMQTSAARKPDVVQERLPLYETSVRSQETAPKTDEGGKRDGGGQRPERAGSDKDAAGRGDRIAGGAEHPAVSERGRAQERNPFVADGSLRFSQTPVRINPDDASNLSPAEKRAARELYAPAGQAGEEARSGSSMPKLFPIGQMHGTYIIAQSEEALYLIDQHAAHERINYEYYYERFGQPEAAAQLLLMPITLEFTPAEAEALKPKLSLLMQVGVEMEHFGGGTFIVRSHPSWFPADQARAVIEEMAAWILEEQKPVDLAKLREKSAILCSCRSSVKANEPLTMAEMESLLDRLRACKQPYTCPHGRPVVISFSNYELQKMFKRIM